MEGVKTFGLNEAQQTSLMEKAQKAQQTLNLYVANNNNEQSDDIKFTAQELEFISATDPALAAEIKTLTAVQNTRKASETGFSTEVAGLDDIDSLSAALDKLNLEIGASEVALAEKQAQAEAAEKNLIKEQKTYDELKLQYTKKREEYKTVSESLKKAKEDLENDLEAQKQKVINEAKNSYDEEEHGSWDAYLQEKLSSVAPNSSLSSLVSTLGSKLSSVSSEMTTLKTKMTSQQNVVSSARAIYTSLQGEAADIEVSIQDKKEQKAQISNRIVEIILNSVSEAERSLVEKNNIDLTEKLSDGSPKYIFAKGKSDNEYHIYEMYENGNSGASLARKYCENSGYDVVKSGNGYINSLTQTDSCNGSKVFYMNSCNTVGSYNGCYSTSSPLSFDLNGDGVKTSDKIINFDIDGDGIVDKINDSADAVLVFDKDGDGISGKDGSECFGDNTDLDGDGKKDGFKNGFEALKALAKEAGVINGKDDNVIDSKDIKFLEMTYGLKMKANGYNSEAVSLSDLGITEINLSETDKTSTIDNFDARGNQLMTQFGSLFKINGQTREFADIWHKKHK